jgi:hypothetical protein
MLVGAVNYDDARQFFAAKTTISSSLGRQLDYLRDGNRPQAHSAVAMQELEEATRLRFAGVIRCIDALENYPSIRFCWAPDLRKFARQVRLPDGAVAVRVLYAYEAWHPGWPTKGLTDVYRWMCTIDRRLKPMDLENGSAAQGFRVGKSPAARRLAASVVADAHVILAEFVRIYNAHLARNTRAA